MNRCLRLVRFLKLGVPAVAIALTASLYSASAHASGSSAVTIHQNVNFRGRESSFGVGDVSIQNLRNTVGNDVISSIEIAPGYTVLACQNSRLRGRCETFTSDVSDLRTIGFNDTVSSLRISSGSLPAVSVFQNVGFAGRTLDIQREGDISIQDLRNSVGNDAISSIRINEGYEVLACRNSGFRGTCETFTSTISDVRRQNSSFNDVISSLRVTRVSNDPPVVTVFQHVRFAGRSLDIREEGTFTIDDLRNTIGNDVISSISIADGYQVLACQHSRNGGSGRCEIFTSDSDLSALSDLRTIGFNDTISFLDVTRVSDDIPVPNTRPVASDITLVTNADTTVAIDVLGNVSDADGDTLTISIPQSVDGLVENSDGSFSYDPTVAFSNLPSGQSDVVSFNYEVSDGTDTATATITIRVEGTFVEPNSLPVASNITLVTNADTTATIDVLGNVSDADGDTLTISIPQSVDGLVGNGDGTFTYDPPAAFSNLPSGQSDVVTFDYEVSDGTDTATATITITVNGTFVAPQPNSPPVASNITLATNAETAVTFNVLSNVTDADGDALTISTRPSGVGLIDNGDGTFTYTPPADAFGRLLVGQSDVVTFDYAVSDEIDTATAMIAITVNGTFVNTPPQVLVLGAEIGILNDNPTNVSIVGSAIDADGDPLTYTISPIPNLTVTGNGLFTFDPREDFSDLQFNEVRIVSFDVTVSDGIDTVTAQYSLFVTGNVSSSNSLPVASDFTLEIDADEPPVTFDVSVLGTVSDDDGDNLTISLPQSVDGLVDNRDGTFTYDPAAFSDLPRGQTEDVIFDYVVSDGPDTVTRTITIAVSGVINTLPTANDIFVTINANETASVTFIDLVLATSDSNGDPITIDQSLQGEAFDADGALIGAVTLTRNADGDVFTYNPAPQFDDLEVGELVTVRFPYMANDFSQTLVGAEIVITVLGVVPAVPTFNIGDEGPTGGTVFQVSDDGRSGLEFATRVFGPVEWGCQQDNGGGVGAVNGNELPVYSNIAGIENVSGIFDGNGTETVVATGFSNSIFLSNASNTANNPLITNCLTEIAAFEAARDFQSGYFLPSISELLEIRRAVSNPTVLDPAGNSVGLETIPLWSSTESTNQLAWVLLPPGNVGLTLEQQPTPTNKGQLRYVLPITSF